MTAACEDVKVLLPFTGTPNVLGRNRQSNAPQGCAGRNVVASHCTSFCGLPRSGGSHRCSRARTACVLPRTLRFLSSSMVGSIAAHLHDLCSSLPERCINHDGFCSMRWRLSLLEHAETLQVSGQSRMWISLTGSELEPRAVLV